MNESEPALPNKAGPRERRRKLLFEDSNAELTLNLLKISPAEEVKLTKQSNSEFFEQLRKSEISAQKNSSAETRNDTFEGSN